MDKNEAEARAKRISSGGGLYRDNYSGPIGVIPKDKWYDGLFALGMEYGYLLAMQDAINSTDSTLQEIEE